MISTILLIFLAIYKVSSTPKFVSYIGQAGPGWGTPYSNEDFLKAIGVPGYGGGSLGYNVLNFAFWVSNSNNGGAAINGAAYDWQNILSRIPSSSLKQTLTGKKNPTADELRAGIKSLYTNGGVQIFISAFGGADHPMQNGASATTTGAELAAYAKQYLYDGVDVDWEEGINGYLGATAGGEAWLCTLTNTLRSNLNVNQKITHAPQAPYFMTHLNGGVHVQYPNGGYNKVHSNCGNQIDWYNIQFYNQGSTTYNTYSQLFQQSIGWSRSCAVYQIMNSNGVTIPEDKVVVGKHTQGDGSTFVSGTILKSTFDQALSAGQWAGGFMTWQFYHEVWPSQSDGLSLISHVIQCNWNRAPTPPTIAPPPTISPPCTIRCGSDWISANNQCGTCCTTNAQCVRGGTFCFADLSTAPCANQSPTAPTTTTQGCSFRCGVNWSQANAQCGTCCETNVQCGSPTTCFADLSLDPCRTHPITKITNTPAPTSTTQYNGDNALVIGVRNRAGSTEWWYTVYLTNVPDGVIIEYVKMRDSSSTEWETGTYYEWNNYYAFNEYAPYNPPLSFKIKPIDGQEITGDNIINSFADTESGYVGTISYAATYEVNNNNNNTNTSWTIYFAIGILIISVWIIALVGGVCIYKRKQKVKGYTKKNNKRKLTEEDAMKRTAQAEISKMIDVNQSGNSDDNEVEIEVELEAAKPITT